MTWTWTLTKMGVGWGLGTISSNPVGWAIGLPTSQLMKMKNEENLNSSTLTLSDKEDAQRIIELATDYQIGACLGIVSGVVISTATKEMAKETLKYGKEAGKEIAKAGFKTELARELITKGQSVSNRATVLKAIPNLHNLEETIKGGGKTLKELLWSSNEKEFIENTNYIIELQNLKIDRIETELNKRKNTLNEVKKTILSLNKENVEYFVKYEKNKNEHHLINRKINQILIRIKAIQHNLHNNKNCCDECRFCQGGN